MTVLALTPAVIGMLLLAAHFLRMGAWTAVIALIFLIPLVGLRRWWVPRVFQLVLGLGALEWVRTLLVFRALRIARDMPHVRMAAILLGVALFTALAAALFELPRVRRWYRGADTAPR
jgi:hypothetical protein